TCGGRPIAVRRRLLPEATVPTEIYRTIAVPVTSAQANPQWETVGDLGSQGEVLRSRLDLPSLDPGDAGKAVPLTYPFASTSAVGGQAKFVALPTKPLHPGLGVRIAVGFDGGPLQVLDFATVGRSEEWREDVLS